MACLRLLIVIWVGLFVATLFGGCASPVFGQTTYRTQTNARPNGVVMQWCNPFCRQAPRLNPLPPAQPTTPKPTAIANQPPAPSMPQQPFNREDLPRLVTAEVDRLRPILTAQIRSELSGELNEMLPGFRREMEQTAVEKVSRAGPEIQNRTLDAIAPRLVTLEGSVGSVTKTHPDLQAKVATLAKTVGGLSTGMGGLAGDVASAAAWAKYGAIGGPAGMAAAVAAGFLFRRMTRRAGDSRTPPRSPPDSPSSSPTQLRIFPVPVDSPPPPQSVVHSNTFTPVVSDRTNEALAWAKDQLVRKHPGSVGTVESLQSLIDQYLGAKAAP